MRAWSRLRRAVDCPACLACLALDRAREALREQSRGSAAPERAGDAASDFELALQANLVVGRA